MAHSLTQAQIDQLAEETATFDQNRIDELAADAAAASTTPTGPELVLGAEGGEVKKLVNLLNLLGYATNDAIKGGPPKLDASVMVDVVAAQAALSVAGEAPNTVGSATWGALYEAAAAKLEADEGASPSS